jgi:polyhydroxyalkanoate synthesis regulator phasin
MTTSTEAMTKRLRDTLAEAKRKMDAHKAEAGKRTLDGVIHTLARFSSDAREAKRLEERITALEARLQRLQGT